MTKNGVVLECIDRCRVRRPLRNRREQLEDLGWIELSGAVDRNSGVSRLPAQRRLALLVELGFPLTAAAVGAYRGTVDAAIEEGLAAAIALIVVFAVLGTSVSCQSVTVGRQFIRREVALRRTVYRGFKIESIDILRPGYAKVELGNFGPVALRWSRMTLIEGPLRVRATRRTIEEAYGGETSAPNGVIGQPHVERNWVLWRIVLWTNLLVLSPFPYLAGWWLSN